MASISATQTFGLDVYLKLNSTVTKKDMFGKSLLGRNVYLLAYTAFSKIILSP